MEITNIPSSPRWTSRQEESLGSSYSRYVKSCFHYRSDLAPYYEQLLRFLELGIQHGTSHLQIPRFFELRNQPQTLPEGGLTAFKELPNGIPRQSPRIAVLEGFPSPECIGSIGAGQLARPELFIGHLDFSRDPNSLHRYFELPALPSDRSNIVHVRLITLGQSLSGVKKTDLHVRDRAAVDRECLDFENQLFRRKHYGATRFRKVHLHNTRVFSVEQIVSFSVTQQKGQPWCGIFLLDRGKSLGGRHNLPWNRYAGGDQQIPDVVPVVPYNFPPNGSSRLGPGTTTEFASLHPYHPIDDLYVQEDGDLELLRQDPFFMLGRLFLRVAQSWSPLLNFVEEDIDACTVGDQEYLQSVLDQLRFNANLVMRIKGFLAENLHVIQERGDASWPRVSEPALEHKILAVQSSLIKNYKFLIVRCEQLAARCERGSGILVSAAQLIEAHEGTNQARQVHDLTRLAFVFIPLTFVASIFGMNVSVFRGYPSIWIYFLVAAPLTMLSWIVSGKLALTGRTWNCLHRCIRRRNRKQSNDQDETQEDP